MIPAPNADETRALQLRLEFMRRKLDVLSSKPARAKVLLEIERLRWQLGEIDDEALRRAEDFADGFNYE